MPSSVDQLFLKLGPVTTPFTNAAATIQEEAQGKSMLYTIFQNRAFQIATLVLILFVMALLFLKH